MASAQEVIKNFINYLDHTALQGELALNMAVLVCSEGKYTRFSDLVDEFITAMSGYTSSNCDTFLKEYCGIILGNSDTGSILGSDAGGTKGALTAESIVPEDSTKSLVYPTTATSVFNGLTVVWPTQSEYSSNATLAAAEKQIVSKLNTWWISSALNLINEAYGLNFNESGTSAKKIKVQFANSSSSGSLASVSWDYDAKTGKASDLILTINMYYYTSVNASDVNGVSPIGQGYLDRTIAHELTHALMAVNVNYYSALPVFVREGVSELVHGIDDERIYAIRHLFDTQNNTSNAYGSVTTWIRDVLSINHTDYLTSDAGAQYAAGYMLLRYLAKQVSTPNVASTVQLDTGASLDTATGVLTISNAYTKTKVDFSSNTYNTYIQDIDASDNTSANAIYGNSAANTITGGKNTSYVDIHGGAGNDVIKSYANGSSYSGLYGEGGNDTIYMYGGKEQVYWTGASSDGNDIVYGFNYSGGDRLVLTNPSTMTFSNSGTSSSSDIIIKSKSGTTLTLKAVNNSTVQNYLTSLGLTGSITLAIGAVLNTANGMLTISSAYTGSSINFSDSRIKNIYAYGNSKVRTIYGNSGANTITGGYSSSYCDIYAGAGNDIIYSYANGIGTDLYGQGGNDTLYLYGKYEYVHWGSSTDGNDTVYNFDYGNGDRLSLTSPSTMKYAVSGSDIVITSSYGTTLTLKSANSTTVKNYLTSLGISSNATGSVTLATGAVLNTANGMLTISSSYTGSTVNFSDSRIKNIYAYGNTKVRAIYGNSGANTITGGYSSSYCDIYAGAGNDIIYSYANGSGTDLYGQGGNDTLYLYGKYEYVHWGDSTDGSDTVYSFDYGNGDRLSLTSPSTMKYAVSGSDIVITSSYGTTLTLKSANSTTVQNYLTSLGISSDVTLATGAILNPANGMLTISSSYTGSTVNFSDSRIKNIYAYGNTKVRSIYGNSGANTITGGYSSSYCDIYAGAGNDIIYSYANGSGTDLYGQGGNDTLYLYGKYECVHWGASSDGSDTVYSFDYGNGDRLSLTSPSTMKYAVSGSDIVITSSYGTTLTLKSANSTTVQNYLTSLGVSSNATGSVTLKTGAVLNLANGMLTITSAYTGTSINFSDSRIKSIYAYGNSKVRTIYGNSGANTITGGYSSSYCDIYAGAGNDIIYSYANGTGTDLYGQGGNDTLYLYGKYEYVHWGSSTDGNDTVYSFDYSNGDRLSLTRPSAMKYAVSGSDIVITSSYGNTLTLKSANSTTVKNYLTSLGISSSSVVTSQCYGSDVSVGTSYSALVSDIGSDASLIDASTSLITSSVNTSSNSAYAVMDITGTSQYGNPGIVVSTVGSYYAAKKNNAIHVAV